MLNLRSTEPGVSEESSTPLSVDNVLWANTVLAAGSAIGLVVYTGKETRAVLNTSEPETKMGTLENEVNKMAKVSHSPDIALLRLMTDPVRGHVCPLSLSGRLERVQGTVVHLRLSFPHSLLFNHSNQVSVLPNKQIQLTTSLRVNLDMGKTIYARQIQNDSEIPQTIVRTSTLPEELGRVEYLLSDKTGTLTRNEMELKKLHMGTIVFGWDSMDEVTHMLQLALADGDQAGECSM